MSTWNLRRMLWKNGATMIARRAHQENQERLDPETIRKINDGLEKLADECELELKEPVELADWQKEIIEQNED